MLHDIAPPPLVGFVGDDDDPVASRGEERVGFTVRILEADFCIDDKNEEADWDGRLAHEPGELLTNLFLLRLGALGIAVAWQIDEIDGTVDEKIIDSGRTPLHRTRVGELFLADQTIDDARLTNIGTTQKGDDWKRSLRQPLGPGHGFDELCGMNSHTGPENDHVMI